MRVRAVRVCARVCPCLVRNQRESERASARGLHIMECAPERHDSKRTRTSSSRSAARFSARVKAAHVQGSAAAPRGLGADVRAGNASACSLSSACSCSS